jgi:hypothetical protein
LADDIEQVRKAEQRRGRRPVDSETVQERRRMAAAFKKILAEGTIDDLKAVMRVYGILPDSPEWTECLRIWREERELS